MDNEIKELLRQAEEAQYPQLAEVLKELSGKIQDLEDTLDKVSSISVFVDSDKSIGKVDAVIKKTFADLIEAITPVRGEEYYTDEDVTQLTTSIKDDIIPLLNPLIADLKKVDGKSNKNSKLAFNRIQKIESELGTLADKLSALVIPTVDEEAIADYTIDKLLERGISVDDINDLEFPEIPEFTERTVDELLDEVNEKESVLDYKVLKNVPDIGQIISSSRPTGGGNLAIFDSNGKVGSGTAIKFTGDGVSSVTHDGHQAVVNITGGGGSGITDGDKGDITVSGSGATWTIDNDTIGLDELSATGTPSSSTFLRGDNTWATPTGSGDVSGPGSSTDNAIARFDSTTGTVIQNSVVTIADTTGNMAGVGTLNTHTIPGGTGTFALTSDLHDAVTVTDSSEIDFTLTGQDITAALITGSIDVLKLDAGVQTSLGLADSALQSGDNISELTNDSGYITSSSLASFGTDNQIPYTNLGGTDFDYSANFTFDGTDLAVNTNDLFVDGSTGRVGIGTTNPSTTLDVAGVATADNFVADGASLSTFAGGMATPYLRTIDLQRTLPTTVGNAVDIGSFDLTNGSGNFEIYITIPSTGNSSTKRYFITAQFGGTSGVWQKVFPVSSSGPYLNTQDYDLEINTALKVTSFRIRRTQGGVAGTANISMIHQGVITDTFTPSTSSGAVTAPTAGYANFSEFLFVGDTEDVGGVDGSFEVSNWNSTGNALPAWIRTRTTNGGNSPSAAEPFLVGARQGISGQAYSNIAEFLLRRYENSGVNSRTAMDIRLTHGTPGATGADIMTLLSSGNVGVGTDSPSARLHTLATTEQLRVGYDASNYFSTTVGSTGGVTFDAVGSGSAFTFSDDVNVAGTLDVVGERAGGIMTIERTPSSATNLAYGTQTIKATHDGDMGDGFGVAQVFAIEDVTGTENPIANVQAIRNGADNSGSMYLVAYNAGTPNIGLEITPNGQLFGRQGSMYLNEQASASTDNAGYGQFWVETATPNIPKFTNDAGTDFTLATTDVATLSSLSSVGTITTGTWSATDVGLAHGGTGASLADPGADRIMFWDDSAGTVTWLTASTGLTISGTSMTVRTASTTQTGIVERATDAEFTTGTDTTRYVTADQVASVTQTLTNKDVSGASNDLISKTTNASSATPTPTGDSDINHYSLTALATNPTFAAPSGTPAEGNRLTIRIHDNGTARTLAWNAIYTSTSEVTLPTTTVLGKEMYLGFIYSSTDSVWRLVAMSNEV